MVLLKTFLLPAFFLTALASPLYEKRADCSDDVQKLADGIQKNIDAQKGESAATKDLQKLYANGNPNKNDFDAAKSKLLGFVNQGIKIRENNQKIAPKGNAAIAGLQKVQQAQGDELKLAQSLSGDKDKDTKTLQTLAKDFADGTKQNQQNLKDATKGCTPK